MATTPGSTALIVSGWTKLSDARVFCQEIVSDIEVPITTFTLQADIRTSKTVQTFKSKLNVSP